LKIIIKIQPGLNQKGKEDWKALWKRIEINRTMANQKKYNTLFG